MFIHVRLIFPGVAGRTVPAYASRPGIFLPAAHLKISRCFMNFSLDNSTAFAIIINAVVAAEQMQWYRSGHNEHDWKSCCRQKRHEGSNPSHCAMKSSRKAWLSGSFLSSIGAAALSGPEVGETDRHVASLLAMTDQEDFRKAGAVPKPTIKNRTSGVPDIRDP